MVSSKMQIMHDFGCLMMSDSFVVEQGSYIFKDYKTNQNNSLSPVPTELAHCPAAALEEAAPHERAEVHCPGNAHKAQWDHAV
jgi:hypothetical protein